MKRRRTVRLLCPVRIWWNEKLGLPECPYVIRWRAETPWGSLRVHHWLAGDDQRAYHDHPWWFVTFLLRGSYADATPGGTEILAAPAVRFRRSAHQHTVIPGKRGAWTVLVTGRKTRAWGFWRGGRFVKANKWFASYGHHPCG